MSHNPLERFRRSPVIGHSPGSAAEEADGIVPSAPTENEAPRQVNVLIWDVAKSGFLTLRFPSRWYTSERVELLLCSEAETELDITCRGDVRSVFLPVGELVQVLIPLSRATEWEPLVKVTLRTAGTAAARRPHVVVALSPDMQGRGSALHHDWSLNAGVATVVSLWLAILGLAFFVLGRLSPFAPLALVAVPFAPALLRLVNIQVAWQFDLSAVAWHSHRAAGEWIPGARWPARALATAVAAATVGGLLPMAWDVGVALGSPIVFKWRLEQVIDTSLQATTSHTADIDLFCHYPERLETRAVLSRRLDNLRADAEAWRAASAEVLKRIPPAQFSSICLSTGRWAARQVEGAVARRDEARAFYASIVFNVVSGTAESYAQALDAIRSLKAPPADSGQLFELALAMYELRAARNLIEAKCRESIGSGECFAARDQCISGPRKALEALLAPKRWVQPSLRQQATYIEARDIAATASLSAHCSSLGPADLRNAVEHYVALLGAVPPDARLDRSLSQINLRNFASGVLDEIPLMPQGAAWKVNCSSESYSAACAHVQKTIIGVGDRRFFSKDRLARNAEWEKPALSVLPAKDFRDVLLSEATRHWRQP